MLCEYSFRSGLYLLSLRVLHTWLTIAAFSLFFSASISSMVSHLILVGILTAGRLNLHLSTNAKSMTTINQCKLTEKSALKSLYQNGSGFEDLSKKNFNKNICILQEYQFNLYPGTYCSTCSYFCLRKAYFYVIYNNNLGHPTVHHRSTTGAGRDDLQRLLPSQIILWFPWRQK